MTVVDLATGLLAFGAGLFFAFTITLMAQMVYGGLRTIRNILGWGRL